eukprot:2763880-Pyramimonas_sp.AAC.1
MGSFTVTPAHGNIDAGGVVVEGVASVQESVQAVARGTRRSSTALAHSQEFSMGRVFEDKVCEGDNAGPKNRRP